MGAVTPPIFYRVSVEEFNQTVGVLFVFIQYPPPLVPPRGEVNAADAFDIGSFDEDDVKGIKVRLGNCDGLTHACLF